MKKKYNLFLLSMITGLFAFGQNDTLDLELNPTDNVTVYEMTPERANGKGTRMATALEGTNKRIAMFKFDLSSIEKEKIVVVDAELEFYIDESTSLSSDGNGNEMKMHKITQEWSEGDAEAETATEYNYGSTDVSSGDVTWEHSSFDDVEWPNQSAEDALSATPDFTPAIYTTGVGAEALFTYPHEDDEADFYSMIEDWYHNPDDNHGIGITSDKDGVFTIFSRHYGTQDSIPKLTIRYIEDPSVSVSEHKSGNEISVYPNPATNNLNISGLNKTVERLEILDLSGRIVDLIPSGSLNSTAVQVDLSNYQSGTYLMRAVGEDVSIKKFVVK